MGSVVKKPWSLLGIMDVIFMPEADDWISQNKIQEFNKNIESMGWGQVTDKIEMIKVPEDKGLLSSEISMEKIKWSSVGNYARKVINERNL